MDWLKKYKIAKCQPYALDYLAQNWKFTQERAAVLCLFLRFFSLKQYTAGRIQNHRSAGLV